MENMDCKNNMPVHVSIIMDGNGRWAKERGKERVYGHTNGVESVRAVTEACVEDGIKYLSLYAFSEENWERPEDEVSTLMNLMMQAIGNEYETMMKNGVRFIVLGNRERLDETLNQAINTLMEQTSGNKNLTMIVFLSYSGKWDILQAAKKLACEVMKNPAKMDSIESLSQEDFGNYLVTAGIPDPDIIIRTSGEKRLSNYLLWQGAYAELFFVDTLWPDFRKEQFRAVLSEFVLRDRRYGKVK